MNRIAGWWKSIPHLGVCGSSQLWGLQELASGIDVFTPFLCVNFQCHQACRWVDIMDARHDGRRPVTDLNRLNAGLMTLLQSLTPTTGKLGGVVLARDTAQKCC